MIAKPSIILNCYLQLRSIFPEPLVTWSAHSKTTGYRPLPIRAPGQRARLWDDPKHDVVAVRRKALQVYMKRAVTIGVRRKLTYDIIPSCIGYSSDGSRRLARFRDAKEGRCIGHEKIEPNEVFLRRLSPLHDPGNVQLVPTTRLDVDGLANRIGQFAMGVSLFVGERFLCGSSPC